ncbi:D-alanyl-D-alanine carboxypeptidase/D-alanyl-D-alanine-endopeptidase [Eikenella sp. S3360]|uniref:D-alanyl-D-alanine carboxypeptidase/D-alanyl-D-alanine-endopeptidase n=1 Tax=Eikenella glucosivorans TaxID=2766967 RepID=A0ABS0ND87_9NEIS|nr:D-alanyl-D-alanine carboxypeptidase/D-alanyl-D-alanine-endopeptidase [Eikenella glucosivorans]MBH5330284.1 D-alanyl-D-alanine carboxypeptidase/D-alanyl-D-alanine-endopeptidase [Eikenella glucosivorans]
MPAKLNHHLKPFIGRVLAIILFYCHFQVAFALDFGRIQPDEAAVYVQDLDSGEILLAHRADVAMNPASTMKLVTTFAALRALGANFRWQTEWRSNAPIANGALQGDLYWVGSGDPGFDQPDLLAMQQQLTGQGILSLNGKVLLDRQVWGSAGSADGFENDAEESFVVPPDPHMIAYKVLWATASRNEAGQPVFLLNPPLYGIPADTSQVLETSGRCGKLSNHVSAKLENNTLVFSGRLPTSCIGEKMFLNVFDAQRFAEESFRGQWLAQGLGGLYGFGRGKTPPNSRILAVHYSKPLGEILTDMNKHSNNLIARSVFLTLGHQERGPHSVHNAEAAVRRQLVAAGLDDEALVLENGSGLSRRERLTARFLGNMLLQAYRSPFRDSFIHTLPIAGTDGTLRGRFRQLGRSLRMKTGTLRDVRALAGYWLPPSGRKLAVVVIINSHRSGGYLPDMDSLVRRIVHDAAELNTVQPAPAQ